MTWLAALDTATLALVVAGACAPALTAATTRDVSAGLDFWLTLWIAASLLHLAAATTWLALTSSAAIIGIRELVALQLRRSRRRPPAGAGTGHRPC